MGTSLRVSAASIKIGKSDGGNSTTWFVRYSAPAADAKKHLDEIGFVQQSRGEGAVEDPTASYDYRTEWFHKSFKSGENLSLSSWQPTEKKSIQASLRPGSHALCSFRAVFFLRLLFCAYQSEKYVLAIQSTTASISSTTENTRRDSHLPSRSKK